ncbi:MAG TPA: cytochrome c oxidase subunit 3 [Candidatus Binataceae bacterium]|nr:cytochrome c oxidase subunit 3 [Candidatus Binataceae bacterium]
MGAGVERIPVVAETDHLREIPPGKMAIWVFLASEILVFGGLITAFVLYQFAHGGFSADAAHVKWRFGAFNTLVLVTSSMTMIRALASARANDRARTQMFLLLTVLLGCAFLGVKTFEYSSEMREGFYPSSGMFWSFYFGMTGLHALHMMAGIAINLMLLIAVTRELPWEFLRRRIEYGGLYWHFVDVVWIFLFPLLYLT